MALNSKKRRKLESLTSLDNADFVDPKPRGRGARAKLSYRCPVSLGSIFNFDADCVQLFYEGRTYNSNAVDFSALSCTEAQEWRESYMDNQALMAFIVYAMVFPRLLRTRIKLNAAEYHWATLDVTSEKGRTKLRQRRAAMSRLNNASTASVFKGIPCAVSSKSILEFMNMAVDEEEERHRFFMAREFSMIFSPRGSVGSSSVYSSCSTILSLLWFATMMGRPCCLESIVMPLNVREREMMETRFECPCQYFDGPVKSFNTPWRDVFSTISVNFRYESIEYVLLDVVTSQRYIEGVYLSDVYAVFRARASSACAADVAAMVESYRAGSKHGVDSGAIVGVFDVIRERPVGMIGQLDEKDLGSIYMAFGLKACQDVKAKSNKDDGSIFGSCVSNKVVDIMSHFDREHWKARKRSKVERAARATLDPAGIAKKVNGERMLDPCDPLSKEKMMKMLKSLCGQVWKPVRDVVEKFDPRFCDSTTFLQISEEESESLYRRVDLAGVGYADVANIYIILILSFSFQRSQVIRHSTVDEYALVADKSAYRLSFKRRKFKTATSGGSGNLLPVSHFDLTPDQSMIVKFLHAVGHRFTSLAKFEPGRRLLLNAKAESWTQYDISSRFKVMGRQWLGIENFGVHTCRTFWSTDALNSGVVDGDNIGEFSSFLQVSRQTMENSYMSSTANSTAHRVGSDVLGAISHAVCTGSTSAKGSRPCGKKLRTRRLSFVDAVKKSLAACASPRGLFRSLVHKRNTDTLANVEGWFKWKNTYFDDTDERFFVRFVSNLN